jgi:hypothetical protein
MHLPTDIGGMWALEKFDAWIENRLKQDIIYESTQAD